MAGAFETIRLTAHRPDAHRYERMARIIKSAEDVVSARGDYQNWWGALLWLNDAKGDMTAAWRSSQDRDSYSPLLDAAWAAEGEAEPIDHQVGLKSFKAMFE